MGPRASWPGHPAGWGAACPRRRPRRQSAPRCCAGARPSPRRWHRPAPARPPPRRPFGPHLEHRPQPRKQQSQQRRRQHHSPQCSDWTQQRGTRGAPRPGPTTTRLPSPSRRGRGWGGDRGPGDETSGSPLLARRGVGGEDLAFARAACLVHSGPPPLTPGRALSAAEASPWGRPSAGPHACLRQGYQTASPKRIHHMMESLHHDGYAPS